MTEEKEKLEEINSTPLNDSDSKKHVLLNYISKEVDRQIDISKWSGLTFWGLFTAIGGSAAFLYDNFVNVISTQNLQSQLFAVLFVVAHLIVISYSIYFFLLSLRKPGRWRRIISQIDEYRAFAQLNLLVNVSLVAILTIVTILSNNWSMLQIKWLAISSGAWLFIKGTFFKLGILQHKKGIRRFGAETHDYTLMIEQERTKRIKIFGIFLLIELLIAALVGKFIYANVHSYDFSLVGTILPATFGFIIVVSLFVLLAKKNIDKEALSMLREVEYKIVTRDFDWAAISNLLAQKYVGFSVEEWIGIRDNGSWDAHKFYMQRSKELLNEASRLDPKNKKNTTATIKLLTDIVVFKQFDEFEAIVYLEETKYHFSKMKSSGALKPFDNFRLFLILPELDRLILEMEEQVQKINQLSNQFEKYLPEKTPNANNPLHN